MPLHLNCTNCNREITGADEDELVARVQEHVLEHSRAHGVSHRPTREQVLERLRRRSGPAA